MVFSTTIFMFLFLPLFLGIYYLLPARFRSAWILLASYAFYAWWRVDFLGLVAAVTLWTWLLGRVIARRGGGRRVGARPSGAEAGRTDPAAKAALAAGVALNLAVLGYFKYFNFGVDSLARIMRVSGGEPFTAWKVILPIGISFYIFQAVSYLVDVYRGDARPAENLIELATYIALFPQLIAGPILRYKDLAPQLRDRPHSFGGFSRGAVRFMAGFCKKVLIADTVAPLANAAFALSGPSVADAWIGMLAYTVQIYFDFSGYSDMAIGVGRMIGFRFMENFDRPYLSKSITEFWRRWHISLSTWLRDYLYIPLGGNRRGVGRMYLHLLVVMVLGGLWHGAAWTFVLWGLWHGSILALERRFAPAAGRRVGGGRREAGGRVGGPLAVAATMILVMIGWVMFRAPRVDAAVSMYAGLIGLNGLAVSDGFSWQISRTGAAVLAAALVLIYTAPLLEQVRPRRAGPPRVGPHTRPGQAVGSLQTRFAAADLAIVPLFLLGILKLAAESYSPFLYFQF